MEVALIIRAVGTLIFMAGLFMDEWKVAVSGLFLILII